MDQPKLASDFSKLVVANDNNKTSFTGMDPYVYDVDDLSVRSGWLFCRRFCAGFML